MGGFTGNLLAYSAQIAAIVAVATVIPMMLRIHSAALHYRYWQTVIAICLALPWIQTPEVQPVTALTAGAAAQTASDVSVAESTAAAVPLMDWSRLVVPLLVAGIASRIGWLLFGWMRLRTLRRLSEPTSGSTFDDLRRAVGTSADVRFSSALEHPVMFGITRPLVVLPESLRAQPAEIQRAVLAHELWHARRRDGLAVVFEELVRAMFWFHPAMWWAIARLRLAREEVVDELAIGVTGERRAYLQALLAFADASSLASASAFAWRRHLFHRIQLISQEDVMSSRRLIASALVLAALVATGGWYAVNAFPMTQSAADPSILQLGPGPLEQGAQVASPLFPAPRRLQQFVPVYPDDPLARTMNAVITVRATVDGTGHVAEARIVGLQLVVPGMQLRVVDAPSTFAANLERAFRGTIRRSVGESPVSISTFRGVMIAFAHAAVAAVKNSRYEAPVGTHAIAFDVPVHFGQVQTQAKAAAAASPLAEGAVRVGGNIKQPTRIRDLKPVYPQEARDAGVQGVIILEARIEGDGSVSAVRILRSIPLLDDAAATAVRQWQFTPTLLNGVPTPVVMTVTVQFAL